MRFFSSIEEVWKLVEEDLPWCDRVRVLVGPHGVRGAVKDELLKRAPALPARAVTTVGEYAREILAGANAPFPKPLDALSQADALAVLGADAAFRSANPALARALRSRPVARRLAGFVSRFDYSWATFEECEAQIEAVAAREGAQFEDQKTLLEALVALWRRGVFWPWSGAQALRLALEKIPEYFASRKEALGPDFQQLVFLWGFSECNEIEQRIFDALAKEEACLPGWLLPSAPPAGQASAFAAEQANPPIAERENPSIAAEKVFFGDPRSYARSVDLWSPHSAFDELEFLRDELGELKRQGVPWREIGVIVPEDEGFKRRCLSRFSEWNVPVRDPQCGRAWRESTPALRWRAVFEAVARQLDPECVLPLLPAAVKTPEFFAQLAAAGRIRGHRVWERISKANPNRMLDFLLALSRAASRALLPAELAAAFEAVAADFSDLLSDEERALCVEFCAHLALERPLLARTPLRMPKAAAVFTEFLDLWSRGQAAGNPDGIWFHDAHSWPAKPLRNVFVLSADQALDAGEKSPSVDHWSEESIGGRLTGMPLESREKDFRSGKAFRRKNFELLLASCRQVTVSVCQLDSAGEWRPGREKNLSLGLRLAPAREGFHPRAGWAQAAAPAAARARPYECVDRAAALEFLKKGSIRVTALEDYFRCPRLFYERHIHRNELPRPLALEADPRVRGEVLHAVIERLTRLKMEGEGLPAEESLRPLVERMVEQESKDFSKAHLFPHPGLRASFSDELFERVTAWLRWEAERESLGEPMEAMKPKCLEHRFELPVAEGLKLTGVMDRVDAGEGRAVIIDYKTGGSRFTGKEIKQGLGVQLVAYAKAVQAMGLTPVASFYLQVSRKAAKISGGVFSKAYNKKYFKVGPTSSGLVDAPDLSETLESASAAWGERLQRLREGDFTANPLDPAVECRQCPYKPICGVRGAS